MQPPTNHPPTISTYLIFNQLRIIHPQFRPKSRSSVLEPSQNILSILTIVIEYSMVVVRARSKEEAVCRRGPHKLWLKRATIRLLSYFRRFNRNLRESLLHDRSCLIVVIEASIVMTVLLSSHSPRVSRCSNLHVVGPGSEILALYENSMASKHDRSCLEMSEADGVDGGAFRKRGLTHLQWAEKPEAPEAERHLGTRISRVPVSPWVPECSNLLAVGPGSEILALYESLMGSKYFRANSCKLQNFQNLFYVIPSYTSQLIILVFSGGTLGRGPWAWALGGLLPQRSFTFVGKDEEDEFLNSHFRPLQYLSQRDPLLPNWPKQPMWLQKNQTISHKH
ncbi:LOW QUALITY PROTEIN: hypothetical protein V1478_003652 [Vespula squamosa]|uniref:Uncharacterized protein n=1 Tax=Vespula squamosa TaxID=30214 RepID=A0ABD2BMF3_VESSQ